MYHFSSGKMFYISESRNIILTTFIIYLLTIVPSFATDVSSTSLSNDNSTNKPKDVGSPRAADSASSSSASSACFASDTLVTLTNHKSIPIHQLRPGDELFTTDGTTIFTTQMMMMLDKNTFSQAKFHTIVTASGHSVSLTALHLIPIIQNENTLNYVPAKQVKVGDVLYVMSDDQVMLSPVIKVIVEMKTGYYAPLTTSGTMLVNGIMASCFSNVKSHEAAQSYMGPLRWYHWLAQSLSMSEPFGGRNTEGVHFVPQTMYEIAQFLYPSALQSS